MNTLNSINTTSISNVFINFKKYLLFLLPENQLYEINRAINYLTKSNRKKVSIKFRMLKELRFIKKQIIKSLHWIIYFNWLIVIIYFH